MPAAGKAVDIAYREEGHWREAKTADALNAAMEQGKVAVTDDVNLLINSGLIDVVVDATGVPAVGAEIGLRAMEHGKHLVMMNVEADVTIGAYLKHEAKRLGVVYTLGAGDEPSSCMELINFVQGLGYPIVAAGKGKNNPLNIEATPPAYMEEAKRRNMNPRMLVEFVDGSKTMVEMAAIANATATLEQVNRQFAQEAPEMVTGRLMTASPARAARSARSSIENRSTPFAYEASSTASACAANGRPASPSPGTSSACLRASAASDRWSGHCRRRVRTVASSMRCVAMVCKAFASVASVRPKQSSVRVSLGAGRTLRVISVMTASVPQEPASALLRS